jgi:hypothetical protein
MCFEAFAYKQLKKKTTKEAIFSSSFETLNLLENGF